MKKYLKMTGNIVLFLVLYLGIQIFSTFIYGIVYAFSNISTGTGNLSNLVQQSVMNNIYIITSISAIVTLIIYILIFSNKENNLWQTCRFKAIKAKQFLNIMIATLGLSMFSGAFVNLLINKFPSYNKVQESVTAAYGSAFSMIALIILIPIFEEILFRGIVFNELKKYLNLVAAIIIQAVIFGIFHGNLLQGIYAFILGSFLALVYYWTDSIVSNISAHIFYNLLGTLVLPILMGLTTKYIFVYAILGLVIFTFSIVPIIKSLQKA